MAGCRQAHRVRAVDDVVWWILSIRRYKYQTDSSNQHQRGQVWFVGLSALESLPGLARFKVLSHERDNDSGRWKRGLWKEDSGKGYRRDARIRQRAPKNIPEDSITKHPAMLSIAHAGIPLAYLKEELSIPIF